MKTLGRNLLENENLNEIFLKENFSATWTPKQLSHFEEEFNDLPKHDKQRRQILLNRFFHATALSHIIINKLEFVSEDAFRIDLLNDKLSKLQRAELMSRHLSQFSNLHFGPAREKNINPKHDAHVRKYMCSKIPAPYQRKYQNEPKLLGGIEHSDNNEYQIEVKHLVKTGGYCHCVKLYHRETLHTFSLNKIVSIQMILNTTGAYDLYLNVIK